MSTTDVGQVSGARFEITCGWCGSTRYSEARGAHGDCESCARRGGGAPALTLQELEKVPFGTLQLDAGGKVLDHEDVRRRGLVGRNLFTDVAPLARVGGFQRRYRDFLSSGEGCRTFSLPFQTGRGTVRVQIFFGRICRELSLVRIRKVLT